MIISLVIGILSAFLWRVRGGLRFGGNKVPKCKIWYAVTFGVYGCLCFKCDFENWLIGFLACYVSYKAFGWGVYIGRLLVGGELKPNLAQYRECELIDDLLYSLHITIKGNAYYLYQFPKLFGFIGTSLTGLIITFLWGLYFQSIGVMASGLAMGVCYWLGGKLEKFYALGKNGWNWGEWVFGFYLGLVLASRLVRW